MTRSRSFRRFRRRRSPYDMQSVKLCDLTTFFNVDVPPTCEAPESVAIMLATGSSAAVAITPATRENVVSDFTTSKGLTFGGLTADVTHFFNPCEVTGTCDNAELTSTCIVLWEAIYVMDILSGGIPAELPDLSNPGIGADFDVDILWKRISRIPFWGAGLIANCQLAISNQNQRDMIRVKTKRRLSERQALMYGFSMTVGSDPANNCTYRIHTDAWFRIASKRTVR